MKRMTKEEVKNLTDREVKIYYFGLFEDRVTPRENTMLLEAELRRRGFFLAC
jgi:hypothetical protein